MSLKTVLRNIQQHNLLPAYEVVVVAVSGGVDSLALLHMLHSARETGQIRPHVATFDHRLRADSTQDSRFVHEIADAWNIPVPLGRAEIVPVGEGIEAAARQARYAFL